MGDIKFLLKFGKQEHIEEFVAGSLFCSSAKSLWDIEDTLKIKGQGDHLEASSILHTQKMVLHDAATNAKIAEMGQCKIRIRYPEVSYIPMFCLFSVFENDCTTDTQGNLKISLSDKTLQVISEHFPNADTVAVIDNPAQFLKDVEASLNGKVKHELIHYYNIDNGITSNNAQIALDYECFKYLTQDTPPIAREGKTTYSFNAKYVYRVLFCKDIYFKDEQEYRIILPEEKIGNAEKYPIKYSTEIPMYALKDFFNVVP